MGLIEVDTYEQNEIIRAAADRIVDLKTCDLRVTSECGQVFTTERKGTEDFLKTMFSDGENRLERQVSTTHALVVEMDPLVISTYWNGEVDIVERIQSAYKRLWHIGMVHRVIQTSGPQQTVMLLRYLASRKKPIEMFEADIRLASREPHMALLAQLPGINPHRTLPDGRRLGDALWAHCDPERLAGAFGVASWDEIPGIGKGRIANVLSFLQSETPKTTEP